MATLIGSFDNKYSSAEINLSVSDIYLEDTVREPNTGPMVEEFVKVNIVYHFLRDGKPETLEFDMNKVEPSGEDVRKKDIEVIIDNFRNQAKRIKKKRIDIVDDEMLCLMFDIQLLPEPGYKNRVEISASGSFSFDDCLVIRLFPSNENMIKFANDLEKELEIVISKSKQKYKDRVTKAMSLGELPSTVS